MKKKRGKKKSLSINKNKNINKLAFLAISVFILAAIFIIPLTTSPEVTGHQVQQVSGGGSFMSNLFSNWSTGNVDVNIAKYIFFFIVILLIFSILNFTGIPEHTAAQWILAILVSFLAVAFITPEEIFTILTAYTALGFTLSMIVPFAILILASAAMLSPIRRRGRDVIVQVSRITIGKILLNFMLWFIFSLFMFYKLIVGYGQGIPIKSWMGITILIVTLLSLGFLVFHRRFRDWVMNIGMEIKRWETRFAREAAIEARSLADAVEENTRANYP